MRALADVLAALGVVLQTFTVQTDDCYLLRVQRMPNPNGTAVFLMHGMLSCSADWFDAGPEESLPALLWRRGYDVWLGNARGTTQSRRHCSLDPNLDAAYWDFSWHEMGVYDLPASIDLVRRTTGQRSVHYVGYSQGTTTFFVMGSERPETMAYIKTATAVAPAAFPQHCCPQMRPIMKHLKDFWTPARSLKLAPALELMPHARLLATGGRALCAEGMPTQQLCYGVMFLFVGPDWELRNKTLLSTYFSDFPAGASFKQLVHFTQLVMGPVPSFRQFDYGPRSNRRRYNGSAVPPAYDVVRITPPVSLWYGARDNLAVERDVAELHRRLPRSTMHRVPHPKFNHVDFMLAKGVRALLFDRIVADIEAFDNENHDATHGSTMHANKDNVLP